MRGGLGKGSKYLFSIEQPPGSQRIYQLRCNASNGNISRLPPSRYKIEVVTRFEARFGSRELFPDLEPRAYLNHAAMSPWSLAVREAMRACMDDYGRRGLDAFFSWYEQRKRLKDKLATLVGGAPDELAFVSSTTEGLVKVALCFPWRKGDRIVVFDGEFPTNVTPWQRAAELYELEIVMLSAAEFREDEDRAIARFSEALERGVRLVAVSTVEFQTGFRMPVIELSRRCHAAGAELCVDAIQALGAVPMDVVAEGIDYLVCGSHKWMMAIDGIAFVYAAADKAAALRPHVAGWLSHESPVAFLLEGPGHLRYDRPIRTGIDFLESGSFSTVGCAALEASLDLLLQLSPEAIFDHVNSYLDVLEPKLVALGFESLRSAKRGQRSGILSLAPPADVDAVAMQKAIGEAGIFCTAPDGYLRFSPHWPNALDEVEYVVASVEASITTASTGAR